MLCFFDIFFRGEGGEFGFGAPVLATPSSQAAKSKSTYAPPPRNESPDSRDLDRGLKVVSVEPGKTKGACFWRRTGFFHGLEGSDYAGGTGDPGGFGTLGMIFSLGRKMKSENPS